MGPQVAAKDVCRYYLHGNCRFGAWCRDAHPVGAKPIPVTGTSKGLDGKDYPRRLGDKECFSFSYKGTCEFQMSCWYDHPEEALDKARKAIADRAEFGRKQEQAQQELIKEFIQAKVASQGPEWKRRVDEYSSTVKRVADGLEVACYVVVDVESNSGTDPSNPSLLFTKSRDLHRYKATLGDRLVRTYSWRRLDTYPRLPDAISAEIGARAAAGENGRHVVRGPGRSHAAAEEWEDNASLRFGRKPYGKRGKQSHRGGHANDDQQHGGKRQKHEMVGHDQCPACPATFLAPTLESRYDDDVNFYPSNTWEPNSKHFHYKRCGLMQHMKGYHTEWRAGTNTWGPGGKQFYRDSTDEDEEIDTIKAVTGGKSWNDAAKVLMDVGSIHRSRRTKPPGGWPVRWSPTIYATAKKAVDVWVKRDGRTEPVWSDGRPCKAVKEDWVEEVGHRLRGTWPHLEEVQRVRDRMKHLAGIYSPLAWEDDEAPAADEKKPGQDQKEGGGSEFDEEAEDLEWSRVQELEEALSDDDSEGSCGYYSDDDFDPLDDGDY